MQSNSLHLITTALTSAWILLGNGRSDIRRCTFWLLLHNYLLQNPFEISLCNLSEDCQDLRPPPILKSGALYIIVFHLILNVKKILRNIDVRLRGFARVESPPPL